MCSVFKFPRPENHYNVEMKELGAHTNQNTHQTLSGHKRAHIVLVSVELL